MKKAPAMSTHSGSAYKPMAEGTGVEDGVRKRIKEENKARKKK